MNRTPLEVSNLRLTFTGSQDPPLIDGLTAVLARPGEVVGLIGPNGAGKSSLIAWLLQAEPARYDSNQDPRVLMANRAVGYVAQGAGGVASIMGWLSSIDNAALSRRLQGTPREQARREAVRLVEPLLRLVPTARQSATFSGGEMAVTAIARELARAPLDILIMDEAVASVDYERRLSVLRWVRSQCRDRGFGVLMVVHEPGLAAHFCDRVLVVRRRPMSLHREIAIEGRPDRGLEDLGTSWLADHTRIIEVALREAIEWS